MVPASDALGQPHSLPPHTLVYADILLSGPVFVGNVTALEKEARSIVLKPPINLDLDGFLVTTWLAEACVRYAGRSLSVGSIGSNPIIYPFMLGSAISYRLSQSKSLDLQVDSAGNQIIGLAG